MIKKMSIFMQPRLFDPEYAHPGLSNALRFVHELVTSCVMQTKDPEAYYRSWGKMFHYRGPETMWSKVFNPQKHERDILMEAFARAHRIEANLLGDVNGRLIIVVIRFYQRGAKVANVKLGIDFTYGGDGFFNRLEKSGSRSA